MFELKLKIKVAMLHYYNLTLDPFGSGPWPVTTGCSQMTYTTEQL
jgi:hypothetical protein